ncbi:MAG: BTAD domain-containing putative transcriptional regulator [bacterium]|nr:BTAD domain-containing putative transcriptional regulator [bacterium]
MDAKIEITTLGQLQIQNNGQVLDDFISTKAVLLVVYLAMHPIEHTRKKLAAMFWGETNDQQALKNLRTVLSSIRQSLPTALTIFHDGLTINLDAPIQVDAVRFEQGCGVALGAPDKPESLLHMQNLASLYEGDFLANVVFRDADLLESWITEKQRQLRQLYTRLLHEIVEQTQKRGEYESGIYYARKLVTLDPYWDVARRQLMRLLAFTNRANAALLEYETFTTLLRDELDAEPEAETTTLYEQIRTQHIRPPQKYTVQSAIVLPDMPFVEAIDDIAIVQRMLNTPQCRLLTLYGISGIGKTALATQVAFKRQQLYQDGAYFISLKRAETARDLPYLIASAFNLDFANHITPLELEAIILDYLKNRHVLLVLDNYDHLLPETDFIQKMLEQPSPMQILVTSQIPLNLFREWLLPLQGLRVPSFDDAQPETYEAVRLFELTAQRINPRFNLQDNLKGVVEICQLVDGLPLALLIAAGWTQIIPINKIKEYIREGQEFNLPTQRDLPPHHQSLEMMLDYTWNTLTAQEQYALLAMSIFNQLFDLDEAQQICGVSLDTLTAIIHKSLVQKYDEKYRMHQLIWRYARKKLLYSDKKEVLQHQYTHYMTRLLRDIQQQNLSLHDYLFTIETQYPRIWNYDWMAKSYQPIYILTLSRFLMLYWEISRGDEIARIQALFTAINPDDLDPKARTLHNLYLARFHFATHQYEQAKYYLQALLSYHGADISWAEWGAVFTLYLTHIYTMIDVSSPVDINADMTILNESYIKLLSLYLDMCDYQAAQDFFPYLLENTYGSIDRALIFVIQGAIFAEIGQLSSAVKLFMEAFGHLADTDEPHLWAVINSLMHRIQMDIERK